MVYNLLVNNPCIRLVVDNPSAGLVVNYSRVRLGGVHMVVLVVMDHSVRHWVLAPHTMSDVLGGGSSFSMVVVFVLACSV